MESNKTFWIFVVIVLVIGAAGVGFSYFARTTAATAQQHAKEVHRKVLESDKLLEDPVLERWFIIRFEEKWRSAHDGADPTDAQLEAGLKEFRAGVKRLPDEVVSGMIKKK